MSSDNLTTSKRLAVFPEMRAGAGEAIDLVHPRSIPHGEEKGRGKALLMTAEFTTFMAGFGLGITVMLIGASIGFFGSGGRLRQLF